MSIVKYILLAQLFYSSIIFSQELRLDLISLENKRIMITLTNISGKPVMVDELLGFNECAIKRGFCIEFKDPDEVKVGGIGDSILMKKKQLWPFDVIGRVAITSQLFGHVKLLTKETVFRIVYYSPSQSKTTGKWMLLNNNLEIMTTTPKPPTVI